MSDNLGTLVSRICNSEDLAYQLTVWQKGRPPTDAELNLVGQINTEERQKIVSSSMPSGWVGGTSRPSLDFHFHPAYSNYFYMGRQLEQDTADTTTYTSGLRHIAWASVNGWVLPVTATQVNETVLVNDDYRNKIVLPFGPSIDFHTNFVFLEVWQALVARNPSLANKPTGSTIYKYGNVEFGGTNPSEDLTDPAIGAETTKRVQIQYRIRVLADVDMISYPTGYESNTQVFARANLTEGEATTLGIYFESMSAQGDPGLWRAGDGDPTNGLGTVDGYVYSIPICAVSRRNRGGWSLSTVNGAISRKAPPSGYVEGAPSACTLTPVELAAVPASDRPDGLYADLIAASDIIDMRFHVLPGGHDKDTILDENVKALRDNRLNVSAKMYTVGGTQYGTKLLYTDELNATGTDNPLTILTGEPDDVRRLFSDVPTYQGKNFEALPIGSKDPSSPSFGANPTKWMPLDVVKIAHPTSLNGAAYPSVMLPDQFELTYNGGYRPVVTNVVTASGASTLSSTGSFLNYGPAYPSTEITGYAVEITGGTGSGQVRTINTIDSADQITIFGSWTIAPDTTSSFQIVPLILTATAVSNTTEMTITITSINGDTSFVSTDIQSANLTGDMWAEYIMYYPAAQGLSLRPDHIWQVNYTNPSSTVLVAPGTDPSINLLRLRGINHSSDFVNPALASYFGSNPVMADCYVDAGSKTLLIQPWQRISNGVQVRRQHSFTPTNGYYSLFHTQFAFELPKSHMPALGYNSIPALSPANATSIFYSGLNVWLISEADAAFETAVNVLGRASFSDDTFEGDKVFVRKDALSYEAVSAGSPDKLGCRVNSTVGGVELPQYIGISRIIGIYTEADFDINGITGTNLLTIPTSNDEVVENIWIGRTTGHTDVTFTVLPNAITGYLATEAYVIVCNVFGYREGFITENQLIAAHEQVTNENQTVTLHTVVTAGLPSSAIVQTTYSRTPYQGSVYSRLEPFADNSPEPFNNRGLVSPTDLALLDVALDSSTVQGVTYTFEVLATQEFVTTLGTARFSGVGNGRFYGLKDVAVSFPDGTPKLENLPLGDVVEDAAGFITRLPLGARFRDADFAGEDLISGDDRGPLIFYKGGPRLSSQIFDESTSADNLGAGQYVTVTKGNLAAYLDTTQYRSTRGGSAYMRLDEAEGAPLTAGGKDAAVGFKALYGIAALVRNFRETVPSNVDAPYDALSNPLVMKSPGGELHLIVATSVSPLAVPAQGIYDRQSFSLATAPSGIGEGFVSVDRYRCLGRPLEFQTREVQFSDATVVSEDYKNRNLPPILVSVYPRLVDETSTVVVKGSNILAAPSTNYPLGVELYARRVDAISDDNVINLTSFITDSTSSTIVFRTPGTSILDRGSYDLVVRSADGKVGVLKNCLESVLGATTIDVTYIVENYYSYPPGTFPSGVGELLTNGTGNYRVTDGDAKVARNSAIFRGTGKAVTEYVRIVRTNTAAYGTGLVSARFSYKLISNPMPINNTIHIKLEAYDSGTYYNVAEMNVLAGSGFYNFVVYGGINGGVDSNFTSVTPVDGEWHDFELVVDADAGTWAVLFDGVELNTGTAAGAIIVGTMEPKRIEISNSVVATTTQASCFVDRYVVQNFRTDTLV